ncbi:protein S100-A7-like [Podarcis lilfordi]|uniref:Protein S100-A7-like n=2 Tax=Podarcis lilfordi TaxID=74358 RepID=A0AA35LLC4_9SAUR|nr:protein S100-A7-like [Podarcis lilfordi]
MPLPGQQRLQRMATHPPSTHQHPPVTHPKAPSTSDSLPHCTLELALEIIVNIYHQFAPREGKDDFLSLKDMTELLKSQAPTFLAACNRNRPNYMKELFKKADVDKTGQLTFEEFTKVFALLADDTHRLSHGEDRCGPDHD